MSNAVLNNNGWRLPMIFDHYPSFVTVRDAPKWLISVKNGCWWCLMVTWVYNHQWWVMCNVRRFIDVRCQGFSGRFINDWWLLRTHWWLAKMNVYEVDQSILWSSGRCEQPWKIKQVVNVWWFKQTNIYPILDCNNEKCCWQSMIWSTPFSIPTHWDSSFMDDNPRICRCISCTRHLVCKTAWQSASPRASWLLLI